MDLWAMYGGAIASEDLGFVGLQQYQKGMMHTKVNKSIFEKGVFNKT